MGKLSISRCIFDQNGNFLAVKIDGCEDMVHYDELKRIYQAGKGAEEFENAEIVCIDEEIRVIAKDGYVVKKAIVRLDYGLTQQDEEGSEIDSIKRLAEDAEEKLEKIGNRRTKGKNSAKKSNHQTIDKTAKKLMHFPDPVIVDFINALFSYDFPLDSKVSYINNDYSQGC